MTCRRLLLSFAGRHAAALCVALSAATALADVPATDAPHAATAEAAPRAADANRETHYRRVFVPADQPQDWPRASAKYLPLAPEEFDRLAGSATREEEISAPHLLRAEYRAQFVDERRLVGEAEFEVAQGSAGGWLALDPLRIAVESFRWRGDPPADLTWGLANDGRIALRADRAGTATMHWSLEGQPVAAHDVRFAIEVPRCTVNSLVLLLPAEWEPRAAEGLIREEAAPPGATEGAGMTQWRVVLGGHERIALRVARTPIAPPRVFVTQADEYTLAADGLAVASTLDLNVLAEPVSKLMLWVDDGATIVSCEGADRTWRWAAARRAANRSEIVLVPSRALPTGHHQLKMRAIGALAVGAPWTLPRIRPQGMLWSDGWATLTVRDPIEVRRLMARDARQTSSTAIHDAATPGEAFTFRVANADGSIEATLGERSGQLHLSCGASVDLSGRESVARIKAVAAVNEGRRYAIEADVARYWQIRSLESEPADAVEDWSVDRVEGNRRVLRIKLRKAITAERPLRLNLVARRSGPSPARRVALTDLAPLAFPAADGAEVLLSLTAIEPRRLELERTDSRQRIAWAKLSPALQSLFDEPAINDLFELTLLDDRATATLLQPNPEFQATIHTVVNSDDDAVRCEHRVRVEPGAPIDRVRIEISPRPVSRMRWQWNGTGELQVQSLPPPAGESAARETVEVSLPSSTASPFELRATYDTVLGAADEERQAERSAAVAAQRPGRSAGSCDVPLLRAPEAAQQAGFIEVRALGRLRPRIDAPALRAAPMPVAAAPRINPVVAAFEYDPARMPFSGEALLTLRLRQGIRPPRLWAWSAEGECWPTATGRFEHRVTYSLESDGGRELSLRWPEAAKVRHCTAFVEGQRWATLDQLPSDGKLTLTLPSEQRFVRVAIQWSSDDQSLGYGGELRPSLPEVEIPVMTSQATFWLPPGYRAAARRAPRTANEVMQRWIGPLARRSGDEAFDPFSALSWSALTAPLRAKQGEAAIGSTLYSALGAAAASAATEKPLTWAEALSAWDRREPQRSALVDGPALASLGIAPGGAVPLAAGDDDPSRGRTLLRQTGLAVVADRRKVLLTSEQRAAHWRATGSVVSPEDLWLVDESLADDLGQLGAVHADDAPPDDAPFVAIAEWKSQPPAIAAPWGTAARSADAPLERRGWSAVTLAPNDRARYVFEPFAKAMALSAFVIAAGAGWWLGMTRWRALVLLACAAMFTALALDPVTAWIAAGAVTGIGVGCLLAATTARSRRRPLPTGHAPAIASPATPGLLMVVACLGAIGVHSAAAAELPAPPNRATHPLPIEPQAPVYDVLIPADDKKQPTGDKYQVPEQLYRILREGGESHRERVEWLMTAALYRARLRRNAVNSDQQIESLVATYELQILVRGARVALPWDPGRMALAAEGVQVDGRLVNADLDAAQHALSFTVDEIGPCRVRVPIQPVPRSTSYGSDVDLPIPRHPGARIELEFAGQPSEVEIPSAQGELHHDPGSGTATATLGSVDRLEMRWRRANHGTEPAAEVDVDQLAWLSLSPAQATVQLRLLGRAPGGTAREWTARIAAPWQVLSTATTDGATVTNEQDTDGGAVLRILGPHAPATQCTVDVLLRHANSSGVGTWSALPVTVTGARVARRRFAVTIDDDLAYVVRPKVESDVINPSSFLASWETAAESAFAPQALTPPTLALRTSEAPGDWQIETRAKEATTSAAAREIVSFSRGLARVRFEADAAIADGPVFQFRLRVPPALRVNTLQLSNDGGALPLRWSVEGDTVSAFLLAPATGACRLALEGEIPVALSAKAPLPLVFLDAADGAPVQIATATIRLYRQSVVALSVSDAVGLSPLPAVTEANETDNWGRWVASYEIDPQRTARADVVVSLNRPTIHATEITRLEPTGNRWLARFEARLHVADGTVDDIRVETPGALDPAHLAAEPAATVRLVERSPLGLTISIVPAQPITGEYRFALSGPLAVAPGERLEAPRFGLAETSGSERYLVLPTSAAAETFAWETHGLRAATLPWSTEVGERSLTTAAYQCETQDAGAVLRPAAARTPESRVLGGDLWVLPLRRQRALVAATLDVIASDAASAMLVLPQAAKLRRMRIDGVVQPATPDPANSIALALPPAQWPRRLELVYEAPFEPSSLTAPTFAGWPTGEYRWAIAASSGMFAEKGIAAGMDPLEWQLSRCQHLCDAAVATAASAASGPDLFARCYAPWASRWLEVAGPFKQALQSHADNRAVQEAVARLAQIEKLLQDFAEKNGLTPIVDRLSAAPPACDEAGELLQTLHEATAAELPFEPLPQAGSQLPQAFYDWRYFQSPGPTLALPANAGSVARPARAALVAAVLLALAAVAIAISMVAPWGRQFWSGIAVQLARWPALVGVVIGLGWWLWLSPSLFGLAIVVFSLFAAWRQGLGRVRTPSDDRQPTVTARWSRIGR